MNERKAQRLAAGAIRAGDLKSGGAVTWATEAEASSEYSDSYRAQAACGAPAVFPRGGDEVNTWLADSNDAAPWLEVTFANSAAANALIICETCGAGAVHEVRDLDTDEVLYAAEPVAFSDSRQAHLLYVPIEAAPRRVRISVAPRDFQHEYKEIDAVGLVVGSLPSVEALVSELSFAAHERYSPSRAPIHSVDDRRLVYASRAEASSEYSSSYEASMATGRPKVYPKGGDESRTWLADNNDKEAWLSLEFNVPEDALVYGVAVFETCGAGATTRIEDENERVLWRGTSENLPRRKARLLLVELQPERLQKVRLFQSPSEDYREIDAVALVTAPLEELKAAPPPKGTPRGGWTRVEGTLAADANVAHLTLGGFKHARAMTTGGPVELTTPSGEPVSLHLDEATFYGGVSTRFEGQVAELVRERRLPAAPDDFAEDDEIVVRQTSLKGPVHVVVLGTPVGSSGNRGGFRDADRVSGALQVSAIALAESESLLEGHVPDNFAAHAFRREKRHPHPHLRVMRGLAATGALTALGSAALWLSSFAGLAYALGAVAGFLLLSSFDIAWRFRAIPFFLESVRDGEYDRPGTLGPWKRASLLGLWEVGKLIAIALLFALLVVLPASVVYVGREDPLAIGKAALLAFAAFALLRLLLWLWRDSGTLLKATRVLMRPTWKGGTTTRPVRVTGVLNDQYTRVERYEAKSEHIGTHSERLENGNTVQRDRYDSWCERHTTTTGPPEVVLRLPDGRVVRAPGRKTETTDLALEPKATQGDSNFALFKSLHEEGAPATLIGVVIGEGGDLRIESDSGRALILGPFGELRLRVLIQLAFVLMLLAAVSALGVFLLA